MQPFDFILNHFDKGGAILLVDVFFCKLFNGLQNLRPLVANNIGHQMVQLQAIAQPKRVRFSQALADQDIFPGGAFIGPDKQVTEQFNPVQLVHAQHGVDVGPIRHVDKGQRSEVVPDQRDIGPEPGNPLVDVRKRLQIGDMHQDKKRLLKGIFDCSRLAEVVVETLISRPRC